MVRPGVNLLLLAASVPFSGCGSYVIEPVSGLADGSTPAAMDWSDWGLTLSRAGAGAGDRVDYAHLLADRRPLDRFLSLVARVGPDSTPQLFPDDSSRLAYAINCYNAMILRSVLALERTGALPRYAPPDLESRYRFRIDRRLQRPLDLRRAAERLAGEDWRVRFALCDGRTSGPPLPSRPILPDLLDAQLTEITKRAMGSPSVVRIDHGVRKQLLLWEGLYDLRERLLRRFEQRLHTQGATILSVLLDWADRPRRDLLNSAVGYKIALMPQSHELNALQTTTEQPRGIFAKLGALKLILPN